jgi:hypothetical protein
MILTSKRKSSTEAGSGKAGGSVAGGTKLGEVEFEAKSGIVSWKYPSAALRRDGNNIEIASDKEVEGLNTKYPKLRK